MHYAWIVAFAGTLVLFSAQGLGRMSYSVILPPMKEGLHLTYTQVGLIGTGNFVGYLLLALLGGFLAVRFGPRKTILVSMIVMGIALFLTGLSWSFSHAFLLRLITGMGNGGAVVPVMGLAAAWFAAKKRGLAAGILTVGTGLGLSAMGFLLPRVMAGFGGEGWRYAWFFLGGTVVILSFVCFALLRDHPREKGTSIYGSEHGGDDAPGTYSSETSFFSTWGDVLRESEIWKLGSVYFMFGVSYIIYVTFFVAYLGSESGLAPQRAGEIFAILGVCSIPSGVMWGWISDILGRRHGLMLAYSVLAVSYLVFALWRSTAGFYVSAVVFGLCMSAIPAIMAAAAGDSVGGRLAPAALGLITLLFGIGQSIGPAVAGWIKDGTGTFSWAFILSAGVSLLGAAGSLMLKKKTQ